MDWQLLVCIFALVFGSICRGDDLTPCEEKLVTLVNQERAKYHLQPVKVEENLQEGARKHCIWMAANGNLSHADGVIENIAMGQGNPEQVIRDWMNSPGHRANLLNPNVRFIGTTGYSGSRGLFWIERFR